MKEKYLSLRKKYKNLPDFQKLSNYFEIGEIESKKQLLREIKKKIVDKIETYINIIESFLQPDTTITCMQESKFTAENERKLAYEIFFNFMSLHRYSLRISIVNSEKENALFIKKAFETYSSNKEKLSKLFLFLEGVWSKNEEKKQEIEYLR